ncbi:MAG TPA: four helix bundle protein [Pyrinomonadaceae bacterium]|jgi:four helix bundle protein
MTVKSYQELIVWQKAMNLVESIYQISGRFPKDEIYGLTSQLRRAVISVPSNIAEGQGRNSTKEFLHHLSIAYGSFMETETQLQISGRLGYLQDAETTRLLEQTAEVARLINGLSRALLNKQP